MGSFQDLRDAIVEAITSNGNNEVTALDVRELLTDELVPVLEDGILQGLEQVDVVSSNLSNPNTYTQNIWISHIDGSESANAIYQTSDYIPVSESTLYTGLINDGPSPGNIFRKVGYYDSEQEWLSGQDGLVSSFTTPANCAFVRVSTYSIDEGDRNSEWIGLFEGASPTWEDYYINSYIRVKSTVTKVSNSENDLFTRGEFDSLLGNVVTIANSDKILFTGCSYEESAFTLKNKSWINKLSNLTDYICGTYAISGQRIIDIVKQLQEDNTILGLTPSTFKPTFVTIANNGNEEFPVLGENLDLYTEQVRAAKEILEAIGAKMILGTSYHVNGNAFVESQLKQIADELGLPYMGIGQVASKMTSSAYAGFVSGSHLGVRTNAATWLEWLYFLSQFKKPRKAIKIFRKRSDVVVSDISDLNYDTILDRAKKFISINSGERSLSESDGSDDYYDRLDETYTSQANVNEYASLIEGDNVAFTDYALFEIIYDKVNLTNTIVYVTGDAGITFYAKDNVDSAVITDKHKYFVFQVTEAVYDSFTETVGTKFTSTSANSGGTELAYNGKLKSYTMGSGWFLCFTADADIVSSNRVSGAGTLLKVLDATPYSFTDNLLEYKYGFDFFNRIFKAKGQFDELTSEVSYADGVYTITLSDSKYFEEDKLKLIAEKSGSFNVSDIYAKYEGGIEKVYRGNDVVQKPYGTELITTRGFDSDWTTTGGWTNNGNSLVSMPVATRNYPPTFGSTDHVELEFDSDGFPQKINRTISLSVTGTNRRGFQKVAVRVIARLFPDIFKASEVPTAYYTASAQVTSDSYDLAYLAVGIGEVGTKPEIVMRKPVDIGWAEIYFETTIPAFEDEFELSLWRDWENDANTDSPMQIFDVSVQLI